MKDFYVNKVIDLSKEPTLLVVAGGFELFTGVAAKFPKEFRTIALHSDVDKLTSLGVYGNIGLCITTRQLAYLGWRNNRIKNIILLGRQENSFPERDQIQIYARSINPQKKNWKIVLNDNSFEEVSCE